MADPEFQYVMEDVERYRERKERISLQQSTRKAEREKDEELALIRKNERRARQGLKLLKKGEESEERAEIADAVLEESQWIVADLVELARSGEMAKVSDGKSLEGKETGKTKKKKKRTAGVKQQPIKN